MTRQQSSLTTMILVRTSDSGRRIGSITSEELLFLAQRVERPAESGSFYVDSDTVDMLEREGAPPGLVQLFRQAVGSRDGLDVTVDAAWPNAAPVTRVSMYDSAKESSIVWRGDVQLRCIVCGGEQFTHRHAAAPTWVMDLDDVAQYTETTLDCYVCIDCRHLHWFLPVDEEEPDTP
jgi:hypothetical protein